MSRLFYHVMQDNLGNLLFGVSGTMRLAGTGTLATIYGDEALTVVLPNPMTNHPSFGSFKCFLGVGDYDFYMAKAGYTFETLTGVQGLGTMADQNAGQVAITGGTVTGLASLGIGTPSPSQSLDVAGAARIQKVGINTAPDPIYSLAVNGSAIIAPGSLQVDRLAVNAAIDANYSLAVNGNAIIAPGGLQLERLAVNAVLDDTYQLAVNGNSIFDGILSASNADITGGDITGLTTLRTTRLAVNTAPDPSYQLALNGPSIFTGTLSANSVAVTGGAVQGLTQLQATRLALNTAIDGAYQLAVNGPSIFTGSLQATRLALNTPVDGSVQLAINGPVLQTGGNVGIGGAATSTLQVTGTTRVERLGINRAPAADVHLHMEFLKASNYAMLFHPTDTDAGNAVISFTNVANGGVGSITTTASDTSYNTSSDRRLKHAIIPLSGALDVVRALNPVAFRWKATDAVGHGLLAQEVAEVVDGVTTGAPDAVDEQGQILPQMIDYSKLVPWLISAVKELTEQVETLTAQLAASVA